MKVTILWAIFYSVLSFVVFFFLTEKRNHTEEEKSPSNAETPYSGHHDKTYIRWNMNKVATYEKEVLINFKVH